MTQEMAGKLLKALYSAAMACLSSFTAVLTDDIHFSQLTEGQYVAIAAFTLGAFGGTYGMAGWAGPQRLNGNAPANPDVKPQ